MLTDLWLSFSLTITDFDRFYSVLMSHLDVSLSESGSRL